MCGLASLAVASVDLLYHAVAFGDPLLPERLRVILSSHAVVGASLNSGAVELYTGRPTFRPAVWSTEQAVAFVGRLLCDGRTVFVLGDGAEIEAARQALLNRFEMALVDTLTLPYFVGDEHASRPVALYRLGSHCP